MIFSLKGWPSIAGGERGRSPSDAPGCCSKRNWTLKGSASRLFQISRSQVTPHSAFSSSRRSHARAIRQSASTVRGETPSTAATASTPSPPKNRSSTIRA